MTSRDSGGPDLDPGTTRLQALKLLGDLFRDAGIGTAQRDARLLTLDAAGLTHADLVRSPRLPLGEEAARKLSSHVRNRLQRVPVARILGEWEFWSLPFVLSPATLVPRPDSETVVAAALLGLKERRHAAKGLRILDLGTGSGCLLVALLSELPGATGVGVDVSPEAVETARFNAARNRVDDRAEMRVGDWFEGLEGLFDLVVSNPPYIVEAVIPGLEPEVSRHDPHLALSGGRDGLDAYRIIAAGLEGVLAPGGLCVVEIGHDQAETVSQLFRDAGYVVEGPFADFGNRPRALLMRRRA
ncbi:peptide chain release factor N(5)-glutamine methyltransferase [Alsobacter sp. R-9]